MKRSIFSLVMLAFILILAMQGCYTVIWSPGDDLPSRETTYYTDGEPEPVYTFEDPRPWWDPYYGGFGSRTIINKPIITVPGATRSGESPAGQAVDRREQGQSRGYGEYNPSAGRTAPVVTTPSAGRVITPVTAPPVKKDDGKKPEEKKKVDSESGSGSAGSQPAAEPRQRESSSTSTQYTAPPQRTRDDNSTQKSERPGRNDGEKRR